jgi:hypothetical protein
VADHTHVTGATGALTAADQLRFMAWLREAGTHGLIGNDFGPTGGERLLLHPLYLVSGALWKVGLSPQLSYLLWLPVACAALLGGFSTYIRQWVADPVSRAAALALALFYFTPLLPVLDWGGIASALNANQLAVVAGAAAPFWQAWGYFASAIGLGLMPLYLLGLEVACEDSKRRGMLVLTAAAGLGAAWLHPWGGLTLLLLTAAVASPLMRRNPAGAVALVLAVVAPLVYYAVLARVDSDLGLGNWQADFFSDRPAWTLLLALLPLAAAAFPGVRVGGHGIGERLLWLWPLAALGSYVLLGSSARLQALAGVTLPLAVLAVRGWQRWFSFRAVGLAALALATLPGMLYAAQTMRDTVRAEYAPYDLAPGEADMLAHLDGSDRQGGVLASSYLSPAVPAFADRGTYAGLPSNSASASDRAREADLFMDGSLERREARALLIEANAPFVADDCRHPTGLGSVLAPLGYTVRRFGCASLYERASPPSGSG